MKARQWFRVQNAADDPATVDIHIVDFIGDWIDDYFGFGVTAKAFVDELAKLPAAVKTIRVHINSPGGDVFGAVNIANALRAQMAGGRTVETIVDGLAASAASIVMMAGSVVRIADNAMVMVHNPWTVAVGSAADMRKTADTMDAIRNTIVATYKWHSQLDDADLVALMDAETWMDADEAIANGFATEKIAGLQAAASLDPRGLAKLTVPAKFKARVDALLQKTEPPPTPAAADEVLAAVDAAGLGTGFARELVKAGLPMDQVTSRIAAAKTERTQRDARAAEIRALCTAAKQPELADGYINGAMSPTDVRAHLTTITAKQDKVEIDAGLRPGREGGSTTPAALDRISIYKNFNKR